MAFIPTIDTPEEFAELSQAYFDECKEEERNITITGLAIALGFCSRQSVYDYSKREGFEFVVSRAKLIVENGYEERLDGASVTGPIFALKNMGWSDKTELAHSSPDGSMSPKDLSDSDLIAIIKNASE